MSPASTVPERVVDFVQELRGLGLPIGIDQAVCFAESFQWIELLRRQEVYDAARATLLNRQEYRDVFDCAFSRYWERLQHAAPQKVPQAPRHRPQDFQRSSLVSLMAERAVRESKEVDVPDRSQTATDAEWLQRKDFSKLTEDELRALRHAMVGIRWAFSLRRTHRLTKSERGRLLDHREALRRAARLGGTIVELPRRAKKEKARPLVLMADVSGSMELYSRLVLQFFHGLSQQLRDVEVFAFGTRLSRVTEAFRLHDLDAALDEVSDQVLDFAGGTRIGESLHAFRRTWASKVLRRGAVVIVVSDGCDTGDPEVLKREMQALQRGCYRLIWLNPRLGQREYQPRVRGMSAALPHVDDFLPIHNFESLRQLRDHLARLPKRKGGWNESGRRL